MRNPVLAFALAGLAATALFAVFQAIQETQSIESEARERIEAAEDAEGRRFIEAYRAGESMSRAELWKYATERIMDNRDPHGVLSALAGYVVENCPGPEENEP